MLVNRKVVYDELPVQTPPAPQTRKVLQLKRHSWLKYPAMVALVVTIALMLISRHAAIVRIGYEIAHLKHVVATLEKENDELRLEVAKMKSPARIQELATSRLGMQMPDSVYYAYGAAVTPKTPEIPKAEGNGNWFDNITRLLGLNRVEARVVR